MDNSASTTSQPILPSSHVALDAIKTLKELTLFREHETGFVGLCKALSAAETVLQQEFHALLSMLTLENWFKPNNTSKKGFEVISEVVDLTMDDVETVSNAMAM